MWCRNLGRTETHDLDTYTLCRRGREIFLYGDRGGGKSICRVEFRQDANPLSGSLYIVSRGKKGKYPRSMATAMAGSRYVVSKLRQDKNPLSGSLYIVSRCKKGWETSSWGDSNRGKSICHVEVPEGSQKSPQVLENSAAISAGIAC